MATAHLRNVAIIAHVDHGKTTLVDQLLYQSGMFRSEDLDKLAGGQHGLVMDTGDLERERGITITSKNCAIQYRSEAGADYRINLLDTPGHSDFGGEVERVLNMADGVLLLVDAFEGPMPQTRFVLQKALAQGLRPIVVVNKIDKPNARPDDVVNEVLDLLGELDAPDEALDFPVLFGSGKNGWMTNDQAKVGADDQPTTMRDLYEAILEYVPAPYMHGDSNTEGDSEAKADAEADAGAGESDPASNVTAEVLPVRLLFNSPTAALAAPLQMLVTTLDCSDYVGKIAIGRVVAGRLDAGQRVTVINRAGEGSQQKVGRLLQYQGLTRVEVAEVQAGDICAVEGLDPVDIGDTIACPDRPAALPKIKVDEPTLSMVFRVNDSPVAGQEGEFVTSRQVWDRLQKELQINVALRVDRSSDSDDFLVSGRGLMHLGVLIETMRREGYELSVGKPQVIMKEVDGKTHEPIELLVVDCPSECQSDVMSLVGNRRAEIVKMDPKAGAGDYVHMEFTIPARGLIGLRTRMLTATQGRAVMHHVLLRYERLRGDVPTRAQGVLIAAEPGPVTAYSLDRLFDRGVFFVKPTDKIYEGQIVGEHNRDNDLTVNLVTNKKLTNVRASGSDDQTKVKPARILSLEACLEFIEDDELVEVTPQSIRMRKRALKESDRRKTTRAEKNRAKDKAGV